MYEAIPMMDIPGRESIIENMVRKICMFDTAFSDYQKHCDEDCIQHKELTELCDQCKTKMGVVSLALTSGLTWEIWNPEELVGIVRISEIKPGEDAVGHYIFFDHKLNGKTEVVQAIIDWAFEEHEGWEPLKRLTVHIPDFAFALAHHATKKLGFGGQFEYKMGKKKIPVEGVKRQAVKWRGIYRDLLSLGLINSAKQIADSSLDKTPSPPLVAASETPSDRPALELV